MLFSDIYFSDCYWRICSGQYFFVPIFDTVYANIVIIICNYELFVVKYGDCSASKCFYTTSQLFHIINPYLYSSFYIFYLYADMSGAGVKCSFGWNIGATPSEYVLACSLLLLPKRVSKIVFSFWIAGLSFSTSWESLLIFYFVFF